mmetsp:Transcript_20758/g.41154  ORF Transcript_20758/g.41154 Transcript_20758/m.41154 type:complete len:162 (+) Transcript_20758:52-537(+)
MGNAESSDEDDPNDGTVLLSRAIKNGDLAEVKRLVDEVGFDPKVGSEEGSFYWDRPLSECMLVPKGGARGIAQYLHAKGAPGYDADVAVEVGDLDRLKELHEASPMGADLACKSLKRSSYSGNVSMARWIFDSMGGDSDRESAYDLLTACNSGTPTASSTS